MNKIDRSRLTGLLADVKEQQKALLMQVMQLTDEQINALAPEHREQIRQLVNNHGYVRLAPH